MSLLFRLGLVPKWNTYYPNLSEANLLQKKFYGYWLSQLQKSNFIDIKGNLSYIFVYLYSVIQHFVADKDIDHLLGCFERIREGYGRKYKKVNGYLDFWISEAYLYLRDYDNAWEAGKRTWKFGEPGRLRISDFINFRAKCKDSSIDGRDLLRILGSDTGLTDFGKKHHEQIANLATIFLEDFHKEYKKNLIEYFCQQFDYPNLTEEDFSKLRDFYPNEKDFIFWKQVHKTEQNKYPYKYSHFILGDIPLECEAVPHIVEVALINEAKRILRECEDTVREEKNLPRVGEGWIAETELFYRLCETFPNEKIVHHGRPAWLAPQHLDIYFPRRNVGIEYQGAHHQNPVEYFGGEEAFRRQQERDGRKKRLCKRNGCKLIHAYEAYNFANVQREIEQAFGPTHVSSFR